MSQNEPGLELHEWETRWSEFEPMFEEDPAGTLPEACDFVEQTLRESDIDPEALVEQPDEMLTAFLAARETSNRLERDEDVDPGDVAAAIENLRTVYETLRVSRPG